MTQVWISYADRLEYPGDVFKVHNTYQHACPSACVDMDVCFKHTNTHVCLRVKICMYMCVSRYKEQAHAWTGRSSSRV